MQDTVEVICPYCYQINQLFIDFSGGEHQRYIEDCQVCCQPMEVEVTLVEDEPVVNVKSSNE